MANDRSRHNPDFWIKAFRVAGFVMLAVVAARLVKVQVIDGGVYGKRAQRQHTIRHKIPAKRGNIYDRNGRLLASSMGVETVWFYKPHVEPSRIGEAAAVFARILGGSADEYFRKIVNGPKYVRVARHIDNETAEALREANLRGVNITQEPLRYYPNNSVAAQLLGFCDPDGVGLEGLEKQFDRYLAGEDGYSVIVQDALNKPISTCEDAPRRTTSGIRPCSHH
ncbi:MAG: hypothetical protein U5N86_01525 [Planctomycetota bacterium]|nr:hypothetical protein [Planctomycetota bacterium]